MKTYDYYIFLRNEKGKVVTYFTLSKERNVKEFCAKLINDLDIPCVEFYDPNDWKDYECFVMFIESIYGLLMNL